MLFIINICRLIDIYHNSYLVFQYFTIILNIIRFHLLLAFNYNIYFLYYSSENIFVHNIILDIINEVNYLFVFTLNLLVKII